MTNQNEKPREFELTKTLDGEACLGFTVALALILPGESVRFIELSSYEKLKQENEKLQSKLKEIEDYCAPHTKYMWAARIIGIIKGIDFRDVMIPPDEGT